MFDQVSVLIPYQSDSNGPRDTAFRWVQNFYRRMMPEAEVCIGKLVNEPFSRSKAINLAAKLASRDIYIIADGDIVYNPSLMLETIKQMQKSRWVIPFSRILRLSEPVSRQILEQDACWPPKVEPDTEPAHAAYFVGGLNVLTKSAFEAVQGYDERFIGWGGEDEAFAYSLDTLVGEHVRLDGVITHFWHPFVGPKGNPHYETNYQLYLRYKAARGNKKAMTDLIRERSV